MTQKFQRGDLVHVVADLGPAMLHFTADIDAIVVGSYRDQYGGSNTQSYTLYLKGRGRCSWYEEDQLQLLEANRADLLQQWQDDDAAETKLLSDLDWIFAHGPAVAEAPKGASLQALATAIGYGNLCGSRGEGIDYYENSLRLLDAARPFLLNQDKAGWLALAGLRG